MWVFWELKAFNEKNVKILEKLTKIKSTHENASEFIENTVKNLTPSCYINAINLGINSIDYLKGDVTLF